MSTTKTKIVSFLLLLFLKSSFFYAQNNKISPEVQKVISSLESQSLSKEKEGNFLEAGNLHSKIAVIYQKVKDSENAIESFKKASILLEKTNTPSTYQNICIINSNLGSMYIDLDDLNNAKLFFKKSLDFRRKLNDPKSLASGLIDIAYILSVERDYQAAVKMLEEALNLGLKINNSSIILNCYNQLNKCYSNIGNVAKAEEYMNKYATFSQHVERVNIEKTYEKEEKKQLQIIEATKSELQTSQAERRAKQLELELNNRLSKLKEDSLDIVIGKKQDSISAFQEIQIRREQTLRQQKQIYEAQIREKEARAKIDRLIIILSVSALVFALVLSIIMIRNFRRKKKDNLVLEVQNQEINNQKIKIENKSKDLEIALKKIRVQNKNITDSINYAMRIQKAMMPNPDDLKKFLPESFVFFRPRDVVSGDFYYFQEVTIETENIDGHAMQRDTQGKSRKKRYLILAAIDCSGHGVPGALLSMVGIKLLDELVAAKILSPDKILSELNMGVRNALKQETSTNRDGMDMAVCVINWEDNIVEYAGAKNPLIYVQNSQLFKLKGDPYSIGGVMINADNRFTTQTLILNEPTWFYIFSDGFSDQFGGDNGKKYLTKNFHNLLYEIHDQNADEQHENLGKTLETWQGYEFDQIDDILIIGFKFEPVNEPKKMIKANIIYEAN